MDWQRESFHIDWEKFMDVSYDGIWIANSEGRIVYLNSAAERYGGLKKEDVLGKFSWELEEEGWYETSVTLKVLQAQETVSVMEFRNKRQIVATGIPIFENSEIKWVYINERDVTELGQVKRDREKARRQMERYRKELQRLRGQPAYEDSEVIISSAPMEKILDLLERVAPTDITVLIEGESGTGKDVMARWIHRNSVRSSAPFIKIDCGALPENLLESELFGYKKGAFTGASKEGKAGLVEAADGGTLFLNEIGEMPLKLQVKLLRLLQEQTFLPVGGVEERKVDVRIVAATNRELVRMVSEGKFREDLYFRLSIVPVHLPALRERTDDILPLALDFVQKYNKKYGFQKEFSSKALGAMLSYSWPGNVRELSNTVERLIVVTPASIIGPQDVQAALPASESSTLAMANTQGERLQDALDHFERQYLRHALGEKGTLQEIANRLGVSKSTLKRKITKHGLSSRRIFE